MSIKKLVKQLEKHTYVKFSEYEAKFYSHCRNMYIQIGLGKSLFSFENYKQVLQEVQSFLNEHLKNKFICLFLPKLIHSTKWKHDYIISRKN